MKWTNHHNVDEATAKLIMAMERPPRRGVLSVTQLIKPPQLLALEIEHYNDIEEDVSTGIRRLIGVAVHAALAGVPLDSALQEETLSIEIGHTRITGRPDLWKDNTITDYKTTSVWAFLLGDKPDWETQVNFYAVLYRETGFPSHKAEIIGYLVDWQQSRAADKGYPPCGYIRFAPKLWAPSVAHSILVDRLSAHRKAEHGSYPPCTLAERWARAETWAVKKRGNKRALRGGIHPTEEAAQEFADQQSFPVEIEHRPGRNIRCEGYCRVAPFCGQWAKIQAGWIVT